MARHKAGLRRLKHSFIGVRAFTYTVSQHRRFLAADSVHGHRSVHSR
jgi:hypothetical protein